MQQAVKAHRVVRRRGSHIFSQMTVRLSALRSVRSLAPGRFLLLISFRDCVDPRAIVRLEGLGQLKKSNDFNGIRTRDLPACSRVPQPTTPWRVIFMRCVSYERRIRGSVCTPPCNWRVTWYSRSRGNEEFLEASFSDPLVMYVNCKSFLLITTPPYTETCRGI
jgi:hypothetical protein